MKIQLRVLPRDQYPVEPGLYLRKREGSDTPSMVRIDENGTVWTESGMPWFRVELHDGIAWSERIECEVME
jgi:hypothetical protein